MRGMVAMRNADLHPTQTHGVWLLAETQRLDEGRWRSSLRRLTRRKRRKETRRMDEWRWGAGDPGYRRSVL